jgi:Zn-dependent peptidase ImmA (M78 family)
VTPYPKDIDYSDIQIKAYKILLDSPKVSIPIALDDIISCIPGLYLCSYSFYAYNKKIHLNDVINEFNTDEGVLISVNIDNSQLKEHIIYYNDKKDSLRIRWTIAHELGHYILKHREKTNEIVKKNGFISKNERKKQEIEANHFAKHLLAPFPLISEIYDTYGEISEKTLKEIFEINHTPVSYIMENWDKIKKYKKLRKKIDLTHKFSKNLKKILFTNICKVCRHEIIEKKPFTCSICRNSDFIRIGNSNFSEFKAYREDTIMIYPEQNYMFCPKCENEDIETNDTYCKICGEPLWNECTNCSEELTKNARYCTICGGESTYLKAKVLLPWDN